ncbi:pentatricopeptide repeat-containing protein At3g50420 [Ipomoea triloba]|uniref:pentatricopeptide repeat-containing protein At3g50420 n=1 Tax=Ipomoea triloba TaxID=35885 RepID=UPI00125D25D9|nr:pentatricopeptide repeat-containing protein At3g50420 [Ipomoea triloba]
MPPSLEASSSIIDLPLLVQKCASITLVRKARELHGLILTFAPTTSKSPYVYNNILSMYARCGSLTDARALFDNMPQRSTVTYNALISAYSSSPHLGVLVFRLLSQLQNERLRPNGSTFTSLLQASSTIKNRTLGSAVHAQCLKFGFLDNVPIQTSLLGTYSNCGDLDSAYKVFRCMAHADSVAWNSFIFGHIENGEMRESLKLFRSMLRTEVCPTQFTFSMLLNACSRLRDYHTGQLLHAQVILSGAYIDLPLHNALLDMYCSCGDTVAALDVFEKIENPDLVSWNSMIAGYAENGDGEKAVRVFVQFLRRSLCKPDEYSFAAVISATCMFPAADYGKPLHAKAEKAGLQSSVYVGSTLLAMYFSNEEVESAHKIFYSVSEKDVVLWTEMIAGHCRAGDTDGALRFFHGMLQDGLNIDSFALSATLNACAEGATLQQGEMIQSLVVKAGYDSEMSVCGNLVDMYAKNGNLKAAELVFSLTTAPDLKCWNTMLGGYGYHGEPEEAFRTFNKIINHGLEPDQVTFLSLLATCSHCGLVSKAKYFWNCMKEKGIKPGPKHYSCMIALLSRAGLLEEAEGMITEFPLGDYHLELWRILLSSCARYGDLRIGIRAAEQVLSLDADDSATNILLSNLYAAAGRWDAVKEMRRKIKGLMLEKEPGLSWLEAVNNKIHVFSSGDQSHLQNGEMQVVLQTLLGNMTHSGPGEFDLTGW